MGLKRYAAALAAGIAALGAGAAWAQDYTFKLHHFLSAKAPSHTEMLVPWARAVEENSGGKVKIEIFPAMTLGGRPPELINQVRDGVVDIIWTVNGYTPGLFPRTEVVELPFVYLNDPAATNLALYEMFESDLKEDYQGVEVMFLHVHSGQAIQMRETEVRSPADLEGKKIRIPTRTGAWVLEALGATPVAMPVPDLPQALQKGVVDGALIPFEIIPPLKIQEQTDVQIELADKTRLGTTTFQVSMNKAKWDSLPADVQQAFRDASGPDWLREVGEVWRGTEEFGINMAVASGNTHVTLTEEETEAFRQALEPVVERWIEEVTAKGIDGAALVQKARDLIATHGSM
ncbi:TRAP-type C4-dicarboxylate transport system, substrate-binding protein [Rhodovulum sp. ES.010]|uniref:TRAP transporter substrate-binding protein n=1 Tax=Rhodovulum sp. ES.010 TaxID=1882821 RepID=UPI000925EC9E|nr:TRAP transporter substrate-binding protein [Rhodovulum sp. ES.010]SIO54249.1 TRAP-type C4-dicarboxylate transport system, substrate-binding protein [Rhodovulum sp. ES.010]